MDSRWAGISVRVAARTKFSSVARTIRLSEACISRNPFLTLHVSLEPTVAIALRYVPAASEPHKLLVYSFLG